MYKAIVITVSDRASSGIYDDKSGPIVCDMLKGAGYEVIGYTIIPDEKSDIKSALINYSDKGAHLIISVGGTGFAERDITPEATKEVIEREAPGISEYMRMRSMEITPRGMLSRGISGIRGHSLIINLPGSTKASAENLGFVLEHLSHGLDMLNGIKE